MKKILYALFILSSIVFIVAHYADNQLVCNISKPIPLIVLMTLLKWNSPYNILIGLGFLFSLAGDIILESFNLFVVGLVAFLIAHVFNIFAFLKKSGKPSLINSLPFYAFGIVFFLLLRKSLGEMALPVAVYILIITTMLWRSFVQRKIGLVEKWAFLGALLFTLSDSLIAVSKFYQAFELSSLFIMLSYWTAQFLIYQSTLSKTTK